MYECFSLYNSRGFSTLVLSYYDIDGIKNIDMYQLLLNVHVHTVHELV